jgi:YHS domain-containing protein
MNTVFYLLFWAVLFFVIMRFGCGAHVMGHRHHPHGEAPPGGPLPKNGKSASREDRDPVCGMTVPTATAKSSLWDGRAYYFCSQDCRAKFEASPATFLGTAPSVHQGAA